MAVKYWAEIVRETPAAKNLCGEQVFYAVRVFKGSTTDPTEEYQLGSFNRIELDGSDSRRAVVTTKNVKDLTEGSVIVTEDPFRKPLDRDYFRVSFTSSKPSTYTPQFTIKVYEPFQSIIPGLSNASTSQLRASTEQTDINNGAVKINIIAPRQNTTFNWGQTGYNPTKWQTVPIPSIQFTKAPTPPDRPGALAEADTIDGWTWDECTGKRWVAVFATYRYVLTKSPYTVASTLTANKTSPNVDGVYSKQIKYTVQALSATDIKANPNATFAQHKAAGRVKVIWTASGWDWASTGKAFIDPKNTKPAIQAQSYKNEAITSRKNFSVKICTGSGGNNGGNNPPPASVTPTPESVKKASNFNPYPHKSTRNFAARIDDEAITYENANKYDQLASFYVDPEIIDLPDKKQGELPGGSAAQLEKLWGFRFMFNPQYISFNMSSNNQVDWTRPNENNAALVASGIGGSITLNILLDRVADMSTMKQWQASGGGSLPQGIYPVSMDAEQCAGILHRGTEYDLEYLFRVVNGNPQKVILMGESPKDGLELLSANMGYMTQLPFIFKISERQRYKVIMQSINVEHSMFTRDMIPIRTVVQIGLERLPDLVSGQFSKFKQAEQLNKISTVLANQEALSNPGRGGGGGRGSAVAK
jgi:hypothetical protein